MRFTVFLFSLLVLSMTVVGAESAEKAVKRAYHTRTLVESLENFRPGVKPQGILLFPDFDYDPYTRIPWPYFDFGAHPMDGEGSLDIEMSEDEPERLRSGGRLLQLVELYLERQGLDTKVEEITFADGHLFLSGTSEAHEAVAYLLYGLRHLINRRISVECLIAPANVLDHVDPAVSQNLGLPPDFLAGQASDFLF